MKHLYCAVLICVLIKCAFADDPANCTHEDIRGYWAFYEGERSGCNSISCTYFTGPIVHTKWFQLKQPDVVEDELGHRGFWTVIYNQGFEVRINHRKYFAFSNYAKNEDNVTTSYCNSVLPGWSHDDMGNNWACYKAEKIYPLTEPKIHYPKKKHEETTTHNQNNKEIVDHINRVQKSWTAFAYPEMEGMTTDDYIRLSGGTKSRVHRSSSLKPELPHYVRRLISRLPEEFDWRNVNGINYVSPPVHQGKCGGCYAFSTMEMLSSRLRIATNNSVQVIFSPQDVITCSEYSQGCDGGFAYLAVKYAQDFGIVAEECRPYAGENDTACVDRHCKRYYVADYKYIGGFYGGCNEDLMKLELVNNGPIAIGFEVYHKEFHHYKGGIYHHTGIKNPEFNDVNHSFLVIGYGVDKKTREKFWIGKNSYGPTWGEHGYIRVRRGVNECNIESIAVAATIIP